MRAEPGLGLGPAGTGSCPGTPGMGTGPVGWAVTLGLGKPRPAAPNERQMQLGGEGAGEQQGGAEVRGTPGSAPLARGALLGWGVCSKRSPSLWEGNSPTS